MRRAIWAGTLAVLAACSGKTAPAPSATSPAPSVSTSLNATVPPGPSVGPVGLPEGTPTSYGADVPPSAVQPDALVPAGASVTDVWDAETAAGSSILVAYVLPGSDPLHQERGLVVWRRFPGEPEPWRPVFGLVDPPARGVVQITAAVGDATGDGSPDALTFEGTGGSGVCGTWRVLDLAANAGVFAKKTCDTTIDVSTDPAGLAVRKAIFKPGDAHCCPSATRISTLVFVSSGVWRVDSTTEQPA